MSRAYRVTYVDARALYTIRLVSKKNMSRNNDRDTFSIDESSGSRNIGESQSRPLLEPGVIKAFIAGLVVGNLNKGMMMGFLVGALGGVYLQQNIAGVPNVTQTWKDLMKKWKNTGK